MNIFKITKAIFNAVGIFFSLLSALIWYLSSLPHPVEITSPENNLAALSAAIAALFIGLSNVMPEGKAGPNLKEIREREETELDIKLFKKEAASRAEQADNTHDKHIRLFSKKNIIRSVITLSFFAWVLKK